MLGKSEVDPQGGGWFFKLEMFLSKGREERKKMMEFYGMRKNGMRNRILTKSRNRTRANRKATKASVQ